MEIWYSKITNLHEVLIIHELKNTGVVPDFSIERTSDGIILKTEKYPLNLLQYLRTVASQKQESIKNSLCRAIGIMHSKGIIHGDLHLENVVINPDTQDVKIIDFDCSYLMSNLQHCADPHFAIDQAKKNDYNLLKLFD